MANKVPTDERVAMEVEVPKEVGWVRSATKGHSRLTNSRAQGKRATGRSTSARKAHVRMIFEGSEKESDPVCLL